MKSASLATSGAGNAEPPSERKDSRNLFVEQSSTRHRDKSADGAARVTPVREEKEIGACTGREAGCDNRVAAPKNRERIGDGNPLEPHPVEHSVCGRAERRPQSPEAGVEGVPDHDAPNVEPDRPAE